MFVYGHQGLVYLISRSRTQAALWATDQEKETNQGNKMQHLHFICVEKINKM